MNFFDEKDLCELKDFDDEILMKKIIDTNASGIKFIPEKYGDKDEYLLPSEAGSFAKWIKKNDKNINIDFPDKCDKIVLQSEEFWIPLVFLANDISLPMYLNIVANYIYDKIRGALYNDKNRVNLDVIFQDKKSQITKKFSFKGDVSELKNITKKFDLNKFMDN